MINSEKIPALLTHGETATLEFKASFDREAIETVVAFANARGGTILVGVANNGSIRGVTVGKETLNDWLGQIKSATSPMVIPDIEAVALEGKTVIAISVGEYPVKPVNTRGKYFKRVSSANHQLSLSEITDLYMQSLQLSWDAHEAPKAGLDDLSLAKIESFIDKVNQSGRFMLDQSPLLALEKLKFIVNNQPTWGALLLFAEHPLRHHIHIGRFKTPSMIIDDRQITDTLFEAVEQAMKFIVSHISVAFSFDGSLQRKERFAYPLPALREALLNAVVHRDYGNSSDIQIKIFDDRITLFSPGTLYGGLTIQDLQTDTYQSRTRNKLIAEAFYLTNNIEKYGSGFIRIRKELKAYPEIAFDVAEVGGGVLVTFRQIDGVSKGVGKGVNEGVNRLFQCIKEMPGARLPELSEKLHVPVKTLERWIKELRDAGLIEFVGAPKTGGYYVRKKLE
ncbi:RNA-binding domain-containing protein [Geoalkalibacter halelectricus]|uniref:RNA-binding domain-containing protein n=1 Tax=Geoalkalibacter halelectricus TaxID=2847045 RepID=UPI003D20E27C